MKRMFNLVAALALVACGASVAKANVLANGNFDLPGPGPVINNWTLDFSKTFSGPTTDLATLEPWNNVAGPGGSGVFYKAFQGNVTTGDLATAHIYQDVPGTPGMKYILTGWAGAEANYSGLIPNTVTKSQLAVEFLDAGSSVIGGSVLDLAAAGLGSVPNPALGFGYAQYMTMAIAPAGTVSVRARTSMIDGYGNPAGGGQAFVVDALDLTCVPEPASIALLGLAFAGLAGIRRRSR